MDNSDWLNAWSAGTYGLGKSAINLGKDALGMNQQNPADAAMPYMNKVPSTISPYYQPYINMGNQAAPQYQQQTQNLINNPAGMMNQIGAGYHESPGYAWQLHQGLNAANQSAAAGGMQGSPMAQQNAMGTAEGLANQDYYNYLGGALGQYNKGYEGLGNQVTQGYGASNELATNLAQSLMNQANLAYQGGVNQNQQNNSMWSGIGSLLGGIGSVLL